MPDWRFLVVFQEYRRLNLRDLDTERSGEPEEMEASSARARIQGSKRRTDLFDCDNLLRLIVHGLVHGAKTPHTQLLHESVLTSRITAWHWVRFLGISWLGFRGGRGIHWFRLWRNGNVNRWTLP